jgi:hypothetical protein
LKPTEQKYFLLMRTLSEGTASKAELQAVNRALAELTETEQVDFNDFQHKVGEVFLKIREELDQGLDEMADAFPDEPDPRKWNFADWVQFHDVVKGHKFEELYTTYARQQPNLHLMWKEIETRL